jgi:hypothetical protein
MYAAGKAASDMNGEWVAWGLTYEASTNTYYLRVLDRALNTYYTDSQIRTCAGMNIAASAYIGANSGGNQWVGDLSETAFMDGTFMEVNNFHGFIHGARGHRWPTTKWYLPMLGDRYDEWRAGIAVTNTNISAGDSEPQLTTFTPRGQVPSLFTLSAFGLGRIIGGNVLGG